MSEGLIRPVHALYSGEAQQPELHSAEYWRRDQVLHMRNRRNDGTGADPAAIEVPAASIPVTETGQIADRLTEVELTVRRVEVRVDEIESLQRRALDLLEDIQRLAATFDAEGQR